MEVYCLLRLSYLIYFQEILQGKLGNTISMLDDIFSADSKLNKLYPHRVFLEARIMKTFRNYADIGLN